ncbi:ornithine cyclodeaminase family protein [Microbacterium sp. 22179]|uniref:ornithine cyclodeaminase family protein n=1 Tax=Microbacterium sp. 22179 TaxID=3453886 RepID=UPI003F8491F3
MTHDAVVERGVPVALTTVIDAVREAFIGFHRGDFDLPVRVAFDGGRILTMPVHHRPSSTAVVKVLRIEPSRDPAISGVIVWTAPRGEMVFDAAEITAIRTGAASGVATALLAAPDASVMTIIGAGAQAYRQVAAVLAVRPIREVRISARTPSRAAALVARLREEHPEVLVVTVNDLAAALRDTDVLTCVTSSTTPVFDAADLPPRIHINAVGSYRLDMRELPADAFTGADVVIDSWDAIREEAGDLMPALTSGHLHEDAVSELGARLDADAGSRAARTIFKSVGLAIQDWAAASAIAQQSATRA